MVAPLWIGSLLVVMSQQINPANVKESERQTQRDIDIYVYTERKGEIER